MGQKDIGAWWLEQAGLRLLGDQVLVLRDEVAEKTIGGIFIPRSVAKDDVSLKRSATGTVLLCGPGRRREKKIFDGGKATMREIGGAALVPIGVQPGDRVVVDYYNGFELDLPIAEPLRDPVVGSLGAPDSPWAGPRELIRATSTNRPSRYAIFRASEILGHLVADELAA